MFDPAWTVGPETTAASVGYQVESRCNSLEALNAFQGNPDKYDLIITDMTMPHMTGDRLSKKLLDIRPDIPIILLTGFSEQLSKEKIKKMGIRGFVMKPIIMR